MTLSATILSDELMKMFDEKNPAFVGWPATVADSCVNWGNAYHAYASKATDVSGDALLTANLPLFISTLQASLPAAAVGTAALAANAFDLAFVAYWLGPPPATYSKDSPPSPTAPGVTVGLTPPWTVEVLSIVTVVAPTVLAGFLLPELATPTSTATAQERADSLAQAFHKATTTAVTVVITGLDSTVPTPLPITNTYTIL